MSEKETPHRQQSAPSSSLHVTAAFVTVAGRGLTYRRVLESTEFFGNLTPLDRPVHIFKLLICLLENNVGFSAFR